MSFVKHINISDRSNEPYLPYTCPVCNMTFVSRNELNRHEAQHAEDKQYKCNFCNESFNVESNLVAHEIVHDAETSGEIKCGLCSLKFTRLISLRNHVKKTHEKEDILSCNECSMKFSTPGRFQIHLDSHKPKVDKFHIKYHCNMCNKLFESDTLLKEHLNGHRKFKSASLNPTVKLPPSQVNYKQSTNDSIIALASTRSTESVSLKNKKATCLICSKQFQKPSQLVRHIRIHTGEKPFQCPRCDKSFTQKGSMDSHIQTMHDKSKPFVCDLCKSKFAQRGNLTSHMKKVHAQPSENTKAFKCEECTCVFKKMGTLNNHIAKMHRGHPVEDTRNKSQLISQSVKSTVPPLSHSQICTKELSTSQQEIYPNSSAITPSSSLVTNTNETITMVSFAYDDEDQSKRMLVKVKKVGHETLHMCSTCSKGFKKPCDLFRHLRTHSLEKPFKCTQCPKTFALKSTLSNHLGTHSIVKSKKCKVCIKEFSSIASLKAHERMHTRIKTYKCKHVGCEKIFKTGYQRRSHMKVHNRSKGIKTVKKRSKSVRIIGKDIEVPDALKITPEGLVPAPTRATLTSVEKNPGDAKMRPYRCSYCPSGFKKVSHLKQHILSHTGEKPFPCNICKKHFVSRSVLKNHIKIHLGIRSFRCTVCNRAFRTSACLRRHITTHSNNRPYLCPVCNKAFKTNVTCRKHIKRHVINGRGTRVNNNAKDKTVNKFELSNNNQCEKSQNRLSTPSTEDVITPSITIQVSSSNTRTTPDKLVTVSKVSLPEQLVDVAVPAANRNISNKAEVDTHQYNSSNISAYKLVSVSTPSNFYSLPTSTEFQATSTSSTLIPAVGPIGCEKIYTQVNQDQIQLSSTAPKPSPATPVVISKPKIIEVNCSQEKPASARKINTVAVTRLPLIPDFEPTHNHSPSAAVTSSSCFSIEQWCAESFKTTILETRDSTVDVNTVNVIETEDSTAVELSTSLAKGVRSSALKNSCKLPPLANQCEICNRTFTKYTDLVRHRRIHTGEKPYRCHICNKTFRVKSTRDEHLRTHQGGEAVTCDVCKKRFSTRSSLRMHMRLHTGVRPCICKCCGRSFRTSGHLNSHYSSHLRPAKQVVPSKSGVAYSSMGSQTPSLTQNQYFVTNDVFNTLQTQTISNYSIVENSSHVDPSLSISSQEDNVNDYIQLIGNMDFDNIQVAGLDLNALQTEMFVQNFVVVTPTELKDGAIMNINQANLIDVSNSNVVLSMSEDGKSYLAEQAVVDSGFSDLLYNSNVIVNPEFVGDVFQQSISGNDPFLTVASDGFSSVKINPSHSGSNVFEDGTFISTDLSEVGIDKEKSNSKQCPDCGRMFLKPSQMIRHRRVHTGEKPHVCSVCKNTFSQKSSLDTHIMFAHSDIRPFECSECPFKTVQKAALKKHFLKAHPQLTWNDAVGLKTPVTYINSETNILPITVVPRRQINITTGSRII